MTVHQSHLRLRRVIEVVVMLLGVLGLVSIVSLSLGPRGFGFREFADVVLGGGSETSRLIIWELRLPRVLLAMIVGAGLSVAGAVFQSLLRNPLAEPYILGISSGGTVGAFVAIMTGVGLVSITTPLLSFAGSGLVLFLVYTLGHRRGVLDPNALLLSGVMVGAFFNALILVMVAILNREIQSAYLWLLGNLSAADLGSLALVGPLIALSCVILIGLGRSLNLISTGDESALQAGVEVEKVRKTGYILASLITGLAVSVSGVIGFVGLLVPHACRLLFGPDNRIVLPASMIGGGTFLVACDLLSRIVLAPAEVPVGAITAAVGAPLFVYLLKR